MLVCWLAVAGCTPARDRTAPAPTESAAPTARPTPAPAGPSGPSRTPSPSATRSASATATARPTAAPRRERADPRWRFYVADRARRTSPWFAGAHRVMIGFGCTRAPYYSPDPRCPGRQGFHHGIDVAMPCGTPLTSAVRGTVVDPSSPGAPGPAYGPHAFRIRTGDVDVLVGHVLRVYVGPGDAVRPGRLVARANDQGAPDGCHLHFEVRRAGGGLGAAVDPAPYLRLR